MKSRLLCLPSKHVGNRVTTGAYCVSTNALDAQTKAFWCPLLATVLEILGGMGHSEWLDVSITNAAVRVN